MTTTATPARAGARASMAILLLGPLAAAGPLRAQPLADSLSGYVTVATDARRHGVSQLPDETALRLGIDYASSAGLFTGAVLGNVDYASRRLWPEPREQLLELYAGYEWSGSSWGVTTTLGHYMYPDTTFDYDYSDLSLAVDFKDRFYYRASYTDDLSSLGAAASGHEIGLAVPLPADVELGAALGRFEIRSPRSLDYTHWNIGATKLAGRFALDLRYYATSREIVSYFGTSRTERWVFSLSYAIRRRD